MVYFITLISGNYWVTTEYTVDVNNLWTKLSGNHKTTKKEYCVWLCASTDAQTNHSQWKPPAVGWEEWTVDPIWSISLCFSSLPEPPLPWLGEAGCSHSGAWNRSGGCLWGTWITHKRTAHRETIIHFCRDNLEKWFSSGCCNVTINQWDTTCISNLKASPTCHIKRCYATDKMLSYLFPLSIRQSCKVFIEMVSLALCLPVKR